MIDSDGMLVISVVKKINDRRNEKRTQTGYYTQRISSQEYIRADKRDNHRPFYD